MFAPQSMMIEVVCAVAVIAVVFLVFSIMKTTVGDWRARRRDSSARSQRRRTPGFRT